MRESRAGRRRYDTMVFIQLNQRREKRPLPDGDRKASTPSKQRRPVRKGRIGPGVRTETRVIKKITKTIGATPNPAITRKSYGGGSAVPFGACGTDASGNPWINLRGLGCPLVRTNRQEQTGETESLSSYTARLRCAGHTHGKHPADHWGNTFRPDAGRSGRRLGRRITPRAAEL